MDAPKQRGSDCLCERGFLETFLSAGTWKKVLFTVTVYLLGIYKTAASMGRCVLGDVRAGFFTCQGTKVDSRKSGKRNEGLGVVNNKRAKQKDLQNIARDSSSPELYNTIPSSGTYANAWNPPIFITWCIPAGGAPRAKK